MKAWLIKIALILLVALPAVFLFFEKSSDKEKEFVAFGVESGESFLAVSDRLEAKGLIGSGSFFYYLARLTGKSADLKAGEYELHNQMNAWEILNIVTGSQVKLYRVTVREGMNMFQIARLLNRKDLVDEVQFLEAAWDPVFIEQLGIPSFTVEGYLFPETYFVPRGSTPKRIIRMFLDMFWSQIPPEFVEKAKESKLSFHEAVIMASVIEKETGLAAEMGLISSVFYNRMERGMRFQSDPTAIYDLMPYGGKVEREHLFRKTPFNTYQIARFPLTPIANPGLLAIQASLYPQDSEYLFFVSRRDGSHQFSRTYAEHKKAIDRFLR